MLTLLEKVYEWSTGGARYSYHTLLQCLDGDTMLATILVALCTIIISGYLVIAWQAFRISIKAIKQDNREAALSLRMLVLLFVFCALAGYGFLVIKMAYPVWRLFAIGLFFLAIITWAYILRTNNVRAIFSALSERDRLLKALDRQDAVIKKLEDTINARQLRSI